MPSTPVPDREGALQVPQSLQVPARELTNKDSLLSLRRPSLRAGVAPKRSSPQLSLQLSIPTPSPTSAKSSAHSSVPSVESPELETPVSLSSPITGVVDLTRSVKTVSREPVAHGGLSDIYQGEWEHLREDGDGGESDCIRTYVAIKLLRVRSMKDQEAIKTRKRLNREVYVWHRLEHPNVAKLFGTSYHMSGRPAMVMQWYSNGNAAAYLERKGDTVDRMSLILDVARGLNYLHTHNPPVIHGDLKGNNVLITDEGRAVLSDFGLSRVLEDLGYPTGLTLSHPDAGPLRWQPPEFCMEEDDDLAPAQLSGDVWSFGCTAYELLTGNFPYAHRTRDGLVFKDMREEIKPWGPSGMEAQTPRDYKMRDLLDSCWCFCPEQRPTMTEVFSILEDICSEPC